VVRSRADTMKSSRADIRSMKGCTEVSGRPVSFAGTV